MQKLLSRLFFALIGFSMLAGVSAGQQVDRELSRVQAEWVAVLQVPATSTEKSQAVRTLARRAGNLMDQAPRRTDPAEWEALINDTYGQVAGAPEARQALQTLRAQIRTDERI